MGINNAGILDFDLAAPTPSLSFNVIDIRGRVLYDPVTLRADELVNGVSSWRRARLAGDTLPVTGRSAKWARWAGSKISEPDAFASL